MARGLQKYIPTPEAMWEHFQNYRTHCKNNPIRVHDYVGKDAVEVFKFKERPLTLEGFENFCFENGIINDLGDYFSNKNNAYEEFSTICSRIRRIIREDQIAGGMVGIYNPSITQRLNGLKEQTESDNKVESTKTIIFKHEPIDGEE